MSTPRLIVLRHARAASPLGTPDIERPLADDGRRDARVAGDVLRADGNVPDRVVCSTALRTRQTLRELALSAPTDFDSRLYENELDGLLDVVREQEHVGRLLLVGHNPSVHELVLTLTESVDQGFPTSAIAVIDLGVPWPDVRPGTGRLTAFWTPGD